MLFESGGEVYLWHLLSVQTVGVLALFAVEVGMQVVVVVYVMTVAEFVASAVGHPLDVVHQMVLVEVGPGGWAQLEVHAAFERDMDELDRALEAALEVHLREELVGAPSCMLPAELCARLEWCHGVSVVLCGGHIVLRGFGVQPTHAARHLAALLAGPRDQSSAFPLVASCSTRESAAWKGTGRAGATGAPGMARSLFPSCLSATAEAEGAPGQAGASC